MYLSNIKQKVGCLGPGGKDSFLSDGGNPLIIIIYPEAPLLPTITDVMTWRREGYHGKRTVSQPQITQLQNKTDIVIHTPDLPVYVPECVCFWEA